MFDTIHLTNMLRSEVEGIPETGLPLDAFPDKIQEIILNLARYENFNVEYTASIVLSAVATAIGNSCHIRIKGEWKTCPSLYMMLVVYINQKVPHISIEKYTTYQQERIASVHKK